MSRRAMIDHGQEQRNEFYEVAEFTAQLLSAGCRVRLAPVGGRDHAHIRGSSSRTSFCRCCSTHLHNIFGLPGLVEEGLGW